MLLPLVLQKKTVHTVGDPKCKIGIPKANIPKSLKLTTTSLEDSMLALNLSCFVVGVNT